MRPWLPGRAADASACAALLETSVLLFRRHIAGTAVFIGDSDRLNTFLNVLTHQIDGIRSGHLPAWDDRMFMGINAAALPYTFPNPLTYLTALAPPAATVWAAGLVSMVLLAMAGWSAYAFIKDSCNHPFAAWVGATMYQCSALATLKIAQNDMSFAVLVHIPLALLAIRRVSAPTRLRCLVALAAVLTSLLYFTFLQKAMYALGLIALYATYRAVSSRSVEPLLVSAGAGIAAVIAAFPRVWTVVRELRVLERIAVGFQPQSFESLYRFQNIRPREILRWVDDGIFGRYPSEAAALGNNINLHEGLLLYTSTFAALIVLVAAVRFGGRWLPLWRSRDDDAPFHLAALLAVLAFVIWKPAMHLLYVAFMGLDFTHARIVVAGLLPMCTVTSIVLAVWLRDDGPATARIVRNASIVGAAVVAVALVVVIDVVSNRQQDPRIIMLDEPAPYLVRAGVEALVFGRPVRLQPPRPEAIRADRVSATTVRFIWRDGGGETGYEIYMREGRGDFRYVTTTGPNVSAFVAEVVPDQQYAFRVRACRRDRCSEYSKDVIASTTISGRRGPGGTTQPTITWLSWPRVVRLVWTGLALVALLVAWRFAPRLRPAVVHVLALAIVVQAFAYAEEQINGRQTAHAIPFAGNDLLVAAAGEFEQPSAAARARLASRLEGNEYRAVVVCDPARFAAFCAPHLSHFWDVRLVDGYSSGIPTRLTLLPWPAGVLSLRALSFASVDSLPWDILSLLGVKHAIVADRAFYTNDARRPRDTVAMDVPLITNPRPVVPRAFFAGAVRAVGDARAAGREALAIVAAATAEPPLIAFVEGDVGSVEHTGDARVRVAAGPDRMLVEFDAADRPRFLVVNELYHPDWRASTNGRALAIHPTNGVMRGVLVPPGATRVTFAFEPFVRPVTAAGFGAMGVVALGGAAWLLERRRSRRPALSEAGREAWGRSARRS